jgi:acyl-coenzyme A thioesterase PaaI-like protein
MLGDGLVVMAWAVMGGGTWGVTARMYVAFRRPGHTGRPIRAEGWVVQEDRRAVRAAGRVIDVRSGDTLATGESTFIAVPPKQLERLKARYGMRRVQSLDTPGPVVG